MNYIYYIMCHAGGLNIVCNERCCYVKWSYWRRNYIYKLNIYMENSHINTQILLYQEVPLQQKSLTPKFKIVINNL
jgi:hypothetical protein